MTSPFFSDHPELPSDAPADWPQACLVEWCSLHRLIEELSRVQSRLGTPLEQPSDYSQVRHLGADIRVGLDRLGPWLEAAVSS